MDAQGPDPIFLMTVKVWYHTGSCDIRISDEATVSQLKKEITSAFDDLSEERQDLYYRGQVLRNRVKLKEYEIFNGSHVYCYRKITVYVKHEMTRFGLMVGGGTTLGELKRMFHAKFSVPIENKKLQLADEKDFYLPDEGNLWGYGIADETEFALVTVNN